MRRFLITAAFAALPFAAFAHEADQYLVLVCGPQVANCDQERAAFRKLYKAAYRNDLNAQRAVARTLWRSSDVVPAQWQAGCAWHMTIVALKPKGLEELDLENMRTNCGLLSPDQAAIARNDAHHIGRRILAGGKIDETVAKPSAKKLDATASPL